MFRGSNTLIGVVNFVTFLVSIPILGGGIWLGVRANSTDCLRFLQWPIIIIGLAIMVISIIGFAGACYSLAWLLRVYLFVMFVVVVALLCFIVFAYAVTDRGHGQVVVGRAFLEYQLSDYSGWLKNRVSDPGYWAKISSCLRESRVCPKMARYVRSTTTGLRMAEPPEFFYQRHLSPIESGCCKPPTSCGYTYMNETYWMQTTTTVNDMDCIRWNNDQQTLCYRCDSCKAGVLASTRRSWRKVSVINIVVLVILVIVYVVSCAAFRNARRIGNQEPFGESRMSKSRPSRGIFGLEHGFQYSRSLVDDVGLEGLEKEPYLVQDFTGDDRAVWKWSGNGKFATRSLYSLLNFWGVKDQFFRILWQPMLPRKISVFGWLWMRQRLLTRDGIAKWGITSNDSCLICDNGKESHQHLVYSCPYATEGWSALLSHGVSSHFRSLVNWIIEARLRHETRHE
ncbi:tetraspanin-3-like [Canna indica]|uniref:Tetraspanin-3-like n=1 Tax=Canna indica TaxID=4628 RepID=A0AAQ3Q7I0_9LILI|nr:tetraspanin-3-like [Canna indica]